ncbi:hypothetical protein AB1Y20_018532 [Prymnesium parvum]|uniref:Uncharacterized protein n=1 Tax=Prymnesium parvum TaxID=97485 RepID=A0AB34JP07_PRYPA
MLLNDFPLEDVEAEIESSLKRINAELDAPSPFLLVAWAMARPLVSLFNFLAGLLPCKPRRNSKRVLPIRIKSNSRPAPVPARGRVDPSLGDEHDDDSSTSRTCRAHPGKVGAGLAMCSFSKGRSKHDPASAASIMPDNKSNTTPPKFFRQGSSFWRKKDNPPKLPRQGSSFWSVRSESFRRNSDLAADPERVVLVHKDLIPGIDAGGGVRINIPCLEVLAIEPKKKRQYSMARCKLMTLHPSAMEGSGILIPPPVRTPSETDAETNDSSGNTADAGNASDGQPSARQEGLLQYALGNETFTPTSAAPAIPSHRLPPICVGPMPEFRRGNSWKHFATRRQNVPEISSENMDNLPRSPESSSGSDFYGKDVQSPHSSCAGSESPDASLPSSSRTSCRSNIPARWLRDDELDTSSHEGYHRPAPRLLPKAEPSVSSRTPPCRPACGRSMSGELRRDVPSHTNMPARPQGAANSLQRQLLAPLQAQLQLHANAPNSLREGASRPQISRTNSYSEV